MARKHKRRTRKRNKKGGFLGPKMSAKVDEGIKGWKDIGADVQARAYSGRKGMEQAYDDVAYGYNSRTQPGGMLGPVPGPPATPPPMGPTMEPTTEKKAGGLLGLGWFGLGGRRLSHSAFINKMLRVRSKSKRNKAIRKYLKGGKKKTKKRKMKKKGRKKKGGVNDTCRVYYEKNTLRLPEVQSNNVTEDEANRYCRILEKDGCLFQSGECFTGDRTEAIMAHNQRRMDELLASGGRRKRKNKTKKCRKRR